MPSEGFFPDGVSVIDKPAGPTSHDVVAVVRRAIHRPSSIVHRPSSGRSAIENRRSTTLRQAQGRPEQRRGTIKVGHTGTLDPLASGVLPVVIGKATRLAKFLSSAEKEYDAHIELGVSTTTFDRSGEVVPRDQPRSVSDLTPQMIEDAVAEFRGTYLQQPPAFSAKKVAGDRAYDLARRNRPVELSRVQVTATALDVLEWRGTSLRVRLVCSAGYYVRSLADALGDRLGTGGHLAGLIRIRSGDFAIDDAIGLDVLDRRPDEAAARVIPLARLLPGLPAITLTPEGASLAARGGFIEPVHASGLAALPKFGHVRLFHPDGHLVAIGEFRTVVGLGPIRQVLHPNVVLE